MTVNNGLVYLYDDLQSGVQLVTMPDAPAPSACGLYEGPGDLNPAAAWGGLRAYSNATCGGRFANVCVQVSMVDTCADMVTSASTGQVVPQTIGGTTCPESTGACTIKLSYDQTLGNNCSGSCDQAQNTVADQFQFLTAASGKCGSTVPFCMWGPARRCNPQAA
jgi:hypothetical protein